MVRVMYQVKVAIGHSVLVVLWTAVIFSSLYEKRHLTSLALHFPVHHTSKPHQEVKVSCKKAPLRFFCGEKPTAKKERGKFCVCISSMIINKQRRLPISAAVSAIHFFFFRA